MTEKEVLHSAPLLRIWTLGNFFVERRSKTGGQWEAVSPAEWKGSTHPKSLLKILLCSSKRKARRDTLIDKLWPDLDPDLGENYLSNAAYKLRQVFKGHEYLLKTFGDHHDSGYELANQSLIWVDADACEHLLLEAEQIGRTSADALLLLQEAMRYFEQGKFLQNEEGLWCYGKRGMLDRLSYRCRLWLAEAYEQQGIIGLAEKQYDTLLEEDPADEDVLCRLMMLHHKQGMTYLVQKCYTDISRQLAKEGQELSSTATTLMRSLRKQSRQLEIGPAYPKTSMVSDSSPSQNLHPLTEDQSLALTMPLKLEETIMFDPKKREMLQTLLTALSIATVKPQGLLQPEAWQHLLSAETDATRVNEATMQGFERLIEACWRLSWGKDLALAEELLPSCMSRLVSLVQQPSKYQQTAANLAAQGFRLYGTFALHRNDLLSRELYYKQAVQYSLLSGDKPLIITAFIGQGDTYYYKNQYGTALQAYQNALPYTKEASPLFQAKVYMSLAVASAHMDQKQDSLTFLGLAHDNFPDRPEADASFSYAEHNLSHMILGEGIMRSQLGQTKMALDIFARAEQPDIIIPERLRVEIFNQQAKTAIVSGDLERGSAYVEAGVNGARALGSQKRYNEAYNNFKQICMLWPQEKRVEALGGLFQSH